jgi:hypothetical protein
LIVIFLTKQSDNAIRPTGGFIKGVPTLSDPLALDGVALPPHPDVINDAILTSPQSTKTPKRIDSSIHPTGNFVEGIPSLSDPIALNGEALGPYGIRV